MNAFFRLADSLQNLVSGIGTSKDKTTQAMFVVNLLDKATIDAAYRADWIARKCVVIPADDSTREWRAWQAEDDQITALEEVENRLAIRARTRKALIRARLYGGGALVMGVEDGGRPEDELIIERVQRDSLKFVHAVSRYELNALEVNRDLSSPFYGEPTYYERSLPDGQTLRLHPSRVIRLLGNEYPDESMALDGWSDSILQAVDDAVRFAGIVGGGIAALVNEAKYDVVKVPDLTLHLQTEEGTTRMQNRFVRANTLKSLINSILLDSKEDWQQIQSSFDKLPEVYQQFLAVASGAADIPATRMLSQSPAGMNSTGESDMRNYYDRISSDQNNTLGPAIARLDEVLIRSALGARPDELFYEWNPLWQLDAVQQAERDAKQAQTFKSDMDSGVFPVRVMREARKNQLIEAGTYPGFEQIADEMPEDEAPVPADGGEPVEGALLASGPGGPDVQKTALNGAQVASLQEIVVAVAEKKMPPETAKAVIRVAFPEIDQNEVDSIIDPLANFEPPKPEPGLLEQSQSLAVMRGSQPRPPGVPAARPRPQLRAVDAAARDDLERSAAGYAMLNRLTKAGWAVGDALVHVEKMCDATPRTLYVRRDVVNVDEIAAWFKTSGLGGTLNDDLHVTLCYSRTPIDWMKVGESWSGGDDETGRLIVKPGGVRLIERMGPAQDYIALLFASSQLSWRHEQIKEAGATFDWPEYQPHITLYRSTDNLANLRLIEPYRGRIVFGPEIFEEVKQ